MSLSNEIKMKLLLGIRGFAIEQIDETHAQWIINSEDVLDIDVSFPPELWEAKHKGKVINWPSGLGIPANTKGAIEILAGDYNAAINAALASVNVSKTTEPLPTLLEALSSQEIEQTVKGECEEGERNIISMDLREKRAEEEVPHGTNKQPPAARYNIENVIQKIDGMFNAVHPSEKIIGN